MAYLEKSIEQFNAAVQAASISRQKKDIISKVVAFEGDDVTDILYECIADIKGINQNEDFKPYPINKRPKDDDDHEQKKDENDEPSSILVDINRAKHLHINRAKPNREFEGMCPKGHWYFEPNCDALCNQCKKRDGIMCAECDLWDHVFVCGVCRKQNLDKIKNEFKISETKSKLIRLELINKPSLSLDLLCGLPTIKGLEQMLMEIQKASITDRAKFALFLIDIDNFKGLNSALGHSGADGVIENVGKILKEHSKQVNDGKWCGSDKWGHDTLYRSWTFRQGGDEFAIIVQCQRMADENSRLSGYYMSFRKEINQLMKIDKSKVKNEDIEKGKKELKERGRKQLVTALNGVNMEDKIKEEMMSIYHKNVDHKNIEFGVDKIGISTGLFVPTTIGNEKDWLDCADKAQEEAKQIKGKNEIMIYFEKYDNIKWNGGIVPKEKTVECLKEGCYEALRPK
eukprot:250641_1